MYLKMTQRLDLHIEGFRAADGRLEDFKVFLNEVDVTEAFDSDELAEFEQELLEACAEDEGAVATNEQ